MNPINIVYIHIAGKHGLVLPSFYPCGLLRAVFAAEVKEQPKAPRILRKLSCVILVEGHAVLGNKLIAVYAADTFDYKELVPLVIFPDGARLLCKLI